MDPNLLPWLAVLAPVLVAVTPFFWRNRHKLLAAIYYIRDWFRCRLRGDCPIMPVRGMSSPMLIGADGTIGGDTLYRFRICGRTEIIPWNRVDRLFGLTRIGATRHQL